MKRVAVVGGGPGGLFFATLLKRADPAVEVTVFERNRADDTFGFGVVFSDATLSGIHDADPVLLRALTDHGRYWERIEVRLKGERHGCDGNGMAAVARKTLLLLLQQRAAEVGVELRFETEGPPVADLAGYDLVVGADGANSRVRGERAEEFGLSVDVATAKFIWFGTTYQFDGLTFVHEKGPHGTFAVHGYPIGDGLSTFIVETDEATWRAAGLDEFDTSQPPGVSDEKSQLYLEKLFAEQIDGHALVANNSRWANFRALRTRSWHTGNTVILGDAAHTAHFSVGSGTKMAMEDAIVLASAVAEHGDDLESALAAYESARRPSVERIQNSARPSLSWWEHFGRYYDAFEPTQFTFHFLSRSISREKLARRDPDFVAEVEQDWRARHGADPLDSPLRVGDRTFPRRLVTGGELGREVAWVTAPDSEASLPEAFDRVAETLSGDPPLVAVSGGASLPRRLLAEEVRLARGKPVVLVEPGADVDDAVTLVLAGRADLVCLDEELA